MGTGYHIDGYDILHGSKLLRTSAKAVKTHSQDAAVIQGAVSLLDSLLTGYRRCSCYDALIEEILDSNLPLELEMAVKGLQVGFIPALNKLLAERFLLPMSITHGSSCRKCCNLGS